jgi:hypothetical protein
MVKQANLFSFSNYRIQTEIALKNHRFKKLQEFFHRLKGLQRGLPFLDGNICQQTKTQFKIQ